MDPNLGRQWMGLVTADNQTSFPLVRRVILGGGVALLICIVAAIGIVFSAIRTALIAEDNLQAFFQAQKATMKYIEQHDGEWPKSWDDLRSVHPEADYVWISERVAIDFGADPGEIAMQTPDTFTAIQPDEPCYDTDYEVGQLIDSLNKHRGTENP